METPRLPPSGGRSYADGTEVAARDHRHLGEGELEARRAVVRQYVALGVTPDQLPGVMGDQGWPMSRAVARAEYDAVMGEWAADHAHLRETTRVAQIRRLEGDLVRYRAAEVAALDGKGGEKAGKTRWQAVVQTEALLARLQGHLAPTQVEVRVDATVVVRDALVEVVASLSSEELDALVDEEEERDRLVAEARKDRGALVVRGVPVAEEPRGS